jgi:hypothetical protein
MLSTRFILGFLTAATLLAWILPSSWIDQVPLPDPSTLATSPWKNTVSIDDVAWGNGAPYVRITFKEMGAPTSISEWSIENEGGERVEIGLGTDHVDLGGIAIPSQIFVATNTTALVAFHASPIGISFREHRCSSYLKGTRAFVPPMNSECPLLSEHKKWNALDGTCRLLIESLPRCSVISPEHIGDMSPSCDDFLRTVPTYTTCISQTSNAALLPTWRIYRGDAKDMVHETGGALTLRDDRGLIVDTFPYLTIGLE